MKTYDAVVIGLGVMGSAAVHSLAKRGVRVLGIDANGSRHALGSSSGPTRATREAYFESPEYVTLAQDSTKLWRDLERDSGVTLLETNGGLYFAPKDHALIAGVKKAAKEHELHVEELKSEFLKANLPGFALPEDWCALREENAGLLRAPECLDAFRDSARRHGAELRFDCHASQWHEAKDGILVQLPDGLVMAKKLVLTLGPWACDLLAGLNLPLTTRRVPVVYYDTLRPELYDSTDFSIYFWATPEGVYAGKPHLKELGAMLVRHDNGETDGPETVNRVLTSKDQNMLSSFADKYIPSLDGGVRSGYVCQYTMTPDNNFIIDHHALLKNTVYATGFSGHGFKFAPVIGEILADLSIKGETNYPIEFLSADRF